MKETVNVNIASEAFILDMDAYRTLGNYLSEIRRCLPENDTETMGDIEARLAEIFRERISSPMRVVTNEVVRNAMKQMGSPTDFGTPSQSTEPKTNADGTPDTLEPQRRIYRSRLHRSIGGICAGLAEHFDLDVTLLRIITLLLILFGGLSLWVYIILWIIIPKEPIVNPNTNKTQKK